MSVARRIGRASAMVRMNLARVRLLLLLDLVCFPLGPPVSTAGARSAVAGPAE